jgi:putative FmdB family regulatory protein
MPIYEYRAADAALCARCGDGFELLQKLSEPELTVCPTCGAPVTRVISAPAVSVSQNHLLKADHFSKRGFTQYKRAGSGVYEKTAGDGPRFIADDGK